MLRQILARSFASVITVFGSLVLVFVIVYLLPGDPATAILDPSVASPEDIAALRQQLGVDQPLHRQFLTYLLRMVQGDFGKSLMNDEPVLPKIWTHVPATVSLTLASLLIAATIGIWLGVLSAVHQNGWIDIAARVIGLFAISMPTFWSGILLILVFSVTLGWFPALGSQGWKTLVLPAVALGLVGAGFTIRLVRNSMLEVLNDPFIVTLRAKGLSESTIMYRHVLRNALIPTLTVLGILSGDLMAGTVVIETVFSRQGIGRVISDALIAKDLPVIQGVIFFTAIVYVLINLLVDISYSIVDPRMRRS